MSTLFEEAYKSILHEENIILCSILKTRGSSPGKKGAKMVVTDTGKTFGTVGGGELEKFCIEKAKYLLSTGESLEKEFKLDASSNDEISMICGGNVTIEFRFIGSKTSSDELEILFGCSIPKTTVYVFGGGHVGKELVPLLSYLDFNVVLLDDRSEFADSERHPAAARTAVCDYSDISESVSIGKDDFAVIMTHGHLHDRDVLLQVCRINPAYIGCIGSRRKVSLTQEYLRENGISEEIIQSIHSPIGVDISSETPQEIAVSIAAELIKNRALNRRT